MHFLWGWKFRNRWLLGILGAVSGFFFIVRVSRKSPLKHTTFFLTKSQ